MSTVPLTLTVRSDDDGATAIALAGELDIDTAARIEPELLLAAVGRPDVRLELSGLTFCDTSGVDLIVRTRDRCAAHGGRMRVCGIPPRAGLVFRLLGVDRTLACSFS
ncbi:anti-sigma factor antagonist [Streptomyces sp. WAC05374]|uniref:STAS domain-containing protein n=1 Tax=Streptomyces sp. WAC05374 TaxID=2487420 RepID=UPI000F88857F|nr:STAS domain-containing protein [Streptomyces sp. WAC05374]RST17683.1 anti-sigma factor antagonist [Streptomyces sp. WAC05374]TDF52684.1 anti-sigma factor antagonist [Streptomyces sp. WAC05374]TDF54103.1 anti-sigma factor antagonist [Streptomyces sp. WAC05374]